MANLLSVGQRGKKRHAPAMVSPETPITRSRTISSVVVNDNSSTGRTLNTRRFLDPEKPANWTAAELRQKLQSLGIVLPSTMTKKDALNVYKLNISKPNSRSDEPLENTNAIAVHFEPEGINAEDDLDTGSDFISGRETTMREDFHDLQQTVNNLVNAIATRDTAVSSNANASNAGSNASNIMDTSNVNVFTDRRQDQPQNFASLRRGI